MPEPTGKLKELHTNLTKKVDGFTIDYKSFFDLMRDEKNFKKLHENLGKKVDGFTIDYEPFKNLIYGDQSKPQPPKKYPWEPDDEEAKAPEPIQQTDYEVTPSQPKPEIPKEETSTKEIPEPKFKEEPETINEYLNSRNVELDDLGIFDENYNTDRNLREGELQLFDTKLAIKTKNDQQWQERRQQDVNEEATTAERYYEGFIRSINEGSAHFLETLDGADRLFADATGISYGGWFQNAANYVKKKSVEGLPETPETIAGNVLKSLGHMTSLFLELGITPSIAKVPKIITQLTASGFLNAYREQDILDTETSEKIKSAFGGALEGAQQGMMLASLGYPSQAAGIAVAKLTGKPFVGATASAITNALGFGGLGALNDWMAGREYNPKKFWEEFIIGGVFSVSGLTKRAVSNFFNTTPRGIRKALKTEKRTEELRKNAYEFREKAKKQKNNKRKAQYQTAADMLDKLADIKAQAADIRKNPQPYMEAIKADPELTKEQKAEHISKINEVIANGDKQTRQINSTYKRIEQKKEQIKTILENDRLPEEVKKHKVDPVEKEISELEKRADKIKKGEAAPEVGDVKYKKYTTPTEERYGEKLVTYTNGSTKRVELSKKGWEADRGIREDIIEPPIKIEEVPLEELTEKRVIDAIRDKEFEVAIKEGAITAQRAAKLIREKDVAVPADILKLETKERIEQKRKGVSDAEMDKGVQVRPETKEARQEREVSDKDMSELDRTKLPDRQKAEKIDVKEEKGVQETKKEFRIGEMYVDEIKLDPKRFQYKTDVDPQTGVSKKLKGKSFERDVSGTISVWKDPKTNETFVINGHHRLQLAKENNVKKIDVKFIDAKNEKEARLKGAIQNIAEGQGTSLDAAKIFKESGIGMDRLKKFGLSMTDTQAREGLMLSNLSKPLFDLVVSGKMKKSVGVTIGENIKSKDIQEQFYNKIKNKNYSTSTVKVMAQDMAASPKKTEAVTDLFGTTQKEKAQYEERAKFIGGVRNILSRAKNFLGKAAKGKDFLERFGNKIDKEKSLGASQEAAEAKAVFDAIRNTNKEIKDIIDKGVERINKGENLKKVQNETAKQIIKRTPDILGRGKRQPDKRSVGTEKGKRRVQKKPAKRKTTKRKEIDPGLEKQLNKEAGKYGYDNIYQATKSVNKRLKKEYERFQDIPKKELAEAQKSREAERTKEKTKAEPKDIEDQMNELQEKFGEGEISKTEYDKQIEPLRTKLRKEKIQARKAKKEPQILKDIKELKEGENTKNIGKKFAKEKENLTDKQKKEFTEILKKKQKAFEEKQKKIIEDQKEQIKSNISERADALAESIGITKSLESNPLKDQGIYRNVVEMGKEVMKLSELKASEFIKRMKKEWEGIIKPEHIDEYSDKLWKDVTKPDKTKRKVEETTGVKKRPQIARDYKNLVASLTGKGDFVSGKQIEKKRVDDIRNKLKDFVKEKEKDINRLKPKISVALINKINNIRPEAPKSLKNAIDYIENILEKKELRDSAVKFSDTVSKVKSEIKAATKDVKAKREGRRFTQETLDGLKTIQIVLEGREADINKRHGDILKEIAIIESEIGRSEISEIKSENLKYEKDLLNFQLDVIEEYRGFDVSKPKDIEVISKKVNEDIKSFKKEFREIKEKQRKERKKIYEDAAKNIAGTKEILESLDNEVKKGRWIEKNKEKTRDMVNWIRKTSIAGQLNIKNLVSRIDKSYKDLGLDLGESTLAKAVDKIERGVEKKNDIKLDLTNKIKDNIKKTFGSNAKYKEQLNQKHIIKYEMDVLNEKGEVDRVRTVKKEINNGQILHQWLSYKSVGNRGYMDNIATVNGKMRLTEAEFKRMEKLLPENLKEYGDKLVKDFFPYAKEFGKETYRKKTGRRLPEIEDYLPVAAESKVDRSDLANIANISAFKSMFRTRKNGLYSIEKNNIDRIVSDYIDNYSIQVGLAEPVSRLNAILMNPKVSGVLKAQNKSYLSSMIRKRLVDIMGGEERVHNDFLDPVYRNFIKSKILMNPSLPMKQMTSMLNVLDGGYAKTRDVINSMVRINTSKKARKRAFDIFSNASGFNMRSIINIESNIKKRKPTNLEIKAENLLEKVSDKKYAENAVTVAKAIWNPTQRFDKVAIVGGGVPLLDAVYRTKLKEFTTEGLSPKNAKAMAAKEAIHKMSQWMNETQQSGEGFYKSHIQTGNLKYLVPFKNAQMGYVRKVLEGYGNGYKKFNRGYREARRDGKSKASASINGLLKTGQPAKQVLMYQVLMPVLFQAVASGGRSVYNLWSEDEETKKQAWRDLTWDSTLRWTDGIFGLGTMINYGYDFSQGRYYGRDMDNIIQFTSDVYGIFENSIKLVGEYLENKDTKRLSNKDKKRIDKLLVDVTKDILSVTGKPSVAFDIADDIARDKFYDDVQKSLLRTVMKDYDVKEWHEEEKRTDKEMMFFEGGKTTTSGSPGLKLSPGLSPEKMSPLKMKP